MQRRDDECAERRFREARARLDEAHGPGSLLSSNPIHLLGVLARVQGDDCEAEPLLKRALQIRRQHLPDTHLDMATSLAELGLMEMDRGEIQRARTLLRQALEIREAALGEKSLAVASTLADLGETYRREDRHQEASDHFDRAQEIRRELLRDDPRLTLSSLDPLQRVSSITAPPA